MIRRVKQGGLLALAVNIHQKRPDPLQKGVGNQLVIGKNTVLAGV